MPKAQIVPLPDDTKTVSPARRMVKARATTKAKAKVADPPAGKPFVSKRGRPTSTQVAAIEENILVVARAMFLEHGFAHTSMEAVAITAGVSKGTLYSRYAEKSELFNAVVADRLAVWGKDKPAPLSDPNVTEAERLYRFGVSFLSRMRIPEIAAFHHLIVSEAYRFPDLAKQFYEQGYINAIGLFATDLRAAADGARWPIGDAREVVQAFVVALLGWIDVRSLHAPVTDAMCEAYVARLVAIFVGGRSSW